MAKQYPIQWDDATWIVIYGALGYTAPEPPGLWLWVYPYDLADPGSIPPGNLVGYALSREPAFLLARAATALPAVLVDMWPQTHFSYWPGLGCPFKPRWNIYRGMSHEVARPVVLFDYWCPEPPPGLYW